MPASTTAGTSAIAAAILIPVYNHAATLRQVVQQALARHPLIIVVDDGCTDHGPDTLADLPVHVVRHARNLGKGAAIRTGAAQAAALGCSHVITMDADGQHKAEDIPAFLAAIQRQPWAVIVGARDFTVPNVPKSSRFGRAFSQFWMFVQTGVRVSDMQSGFRAYPVAVLQSVACTDQGYSFEIEILVRSAWAGFAIEEIPVQVVYPPAQERCSHFRALADNLRISWLNTRLTIRAFTPLPFSNKSLKMEGRLSLRHPGKSLATLLHHGSSPKELARSAAWAIFVSTLPLPGLQTILLLFLIQWKRLNRLCALLMVPLTWPPLVPGLGVLLGYRLLHGEWLTEFSVQTLGYEAGYRLLDWAAGSLVLAPCLGLAAGAGVYLAARGCRHLCAQPETAAASDTAQTSGSTRNAGPGPDSAASAGTAPAWSSKSLASRLKHQFFYALVALHLIPVARLVLYPVSFYYALHPGIRKRYQAYLMHRFGAAHGLTGLLRTARAYKNFADVLLDRAIFRIRGKIPLVPDQRTTAILRSLLAEGRGCMLVSGHFGSWQLGILALEQAGRPICLVQWVDEEDVDAHYFQGGEKAHDVRVINARKGLSAVLEIHAALRDNCLVCFMGDRLAPHDRECITLPFLGEDISIPAAPYVLASACNAPLLFAFSIRSKGVTTGLAPVVCRVGPGIRKNPQKLRAAARTFLELLEDCTQKYPYHFFNFYDLWRSSHDQTGTHR